MTETDLLQLIAQSKKTNELKLSSKNLAALPEELAQLTSLQSLDLSFNKLTDLPDWMAQLTNLQHLDISYNKLSILPKCITHLRNLQSLILTSNSLISLPQSTIQLTQLRTIDLSGNRLSTIPEVITQLFYLRSLNLSSNKLTQLPKLMMPFNRLLSLDLSNNSMTELPEYIGEITSLQALNISDNRLTRLHERLAMLKELQSLNIRNNSLSTIPEWIGDFNSLQILRIGGDTPHNKRLSSFPEWISQLNNLHSLDLSANNLSTLPNWLGNPGILPHLRILRLGKNPLTMPPIEILGRAALTNEFQNANIEAIRSYLRQLQEANSVYFYEAKLLIIGEGGAGKTSLANKLLNPTCQLPSEEKSTKGIDILSWQFPLPKELPRSKETVDEDYKVNIWDFGGQEIYFATHQFFLTRRSVYLLVADTRRQHTDFYNWLRMQETFGGASAVLLVKNRNRQHGNSFTIENLPQLRERFPNLKEIIELDLNEVPNNYSWTDLLHHLKEYLLRLDHIGQPRPATWVAVRQTIDVDERDVIRWEEFVALCREQGMKREDDIKLLGDYLHNLGDILYFDEDAVLQDYVILKPTWGLDAVYKVLDNGEIIEQLGRFTRQQLRQLWSEARYQGYREQLLRLMANFQLCYPLAEDGDTFIAPQLLTEDPPHYDWDGNENLQLRYVYPVFMPRGILSRAIVKLHRRIEAQRLVWRSGVILNDGYARAEVLELRGDQQIRIRVSGRNKRDLLMEIVRALDELHQSFPRLHFERRIPCNCEGCVERSEPHFYALEKLQERLANHKRTIECQLPPYDEVEIRKMLDEFGDLRGHGMGRGDTNVFAERVYFGDHNDGDQYDIGDIHDSTGIAIGKQASASVEK